MCLLTALGCVGSAQAATDYIVDVSNATADNITVFNTLQDLQSAGIIWDDGDTVTLHNDDTTLTAEFDIDKNVTFQTNGGVPHLIGSAGTAAFLANTAPSAGTVTFGNGLTLTGFVPAVNINQMSVSTDTMTFNNNPGNAVIVDSGTFTATDSMFSNNRTTSSFGGAIYMNASAADATVNLNATSGNSNSFSNNTVFGGDLSSIWMTGSGGNTAIINITGTGDLFMLDPMHSDDSTGYNIAVMKTGDGFWQLGGVSELNANANTVTINGGSLDLAPGGQIVMKQGQTNDFMLAAGTTLVSRGASGSQANLIDVGTTGSITLDTNSTLAFDLASADVTTDLLTLNGTMAGAAIGANNIRIMAIDAQSGDVYHLAKSDQASSAATSGHLFFGTSTADYVAVRSAASGDMMYRLDASDGQTLKLMAFGAGDNTTVTWTGATSDVWKSAGDANWNGTVNGFTVDTFLNGDNVVFDNSTLAKNITVDSAGVTVDTMTITDTANATNFTGGAITATGTVTVAAGATMGLVAGSTTALTAGSVDFGAGSALNITGYTASSAYPDPSPKKVIATSGGISIDVNTVTIAGSASVDYLSAQAELTNGGKDLTVKTELTWYSANSATPAHGDFTIASGETFTLNAVLADNDTSSNNSPTWDGKTLTKKGDGTLELQAANTYQGGTIIQNGTVKLSGNGALGTGSVSLSTTNSTLELTNGVSVANTVSGTGKVLKSGSGTAILSSANVYSGGTTISGGTLRLTNAGAVGSGTVDIIGPSSTLDLNNLASFGNVIAGNGKLKKSGASETVMTADNTFSGGTSIDAGSIKLMGTGTLGSGVVYLANGASLELAHAGNTTFANEISGNGKLVKSNNAAITTITGANTYTGGTDLQGGRIKLTGAGTLGNGEVAFSNSAILELDTNANITNKITGAGSVMKTGTTTTTISGANTYSGNTTVMDGTLRLAGAGTLGNGAGSVDLQTALATLELASNATIGNSIGGAGKVVKSGSSVTTLTGINSYAGGTTVNAGTLRLAGSGTLGTGDVGIASGAGLELASSGDFANDITGAGQVVKSGDGTVTTLSGNNTYTGGTSINSGTLKLDGTGGIGTGAVTIAQGGTLELGGNNTVGNVIGGEGRLIKTGTGTVVFTGTNTLTGDIEIQNGTVRLAGSGTLGSGAVDLQSSGSVLELAGNGIVANTIGGNGSLVKSGTGISALTGANTYAGDTIVNGGILRLEAGGTLGAGGVNLAGGHLNVDNDQTIANIISGNGGFIKSGTGTTVLTGANTYAGGTLVDNGTLRLENAGNLGANTVELWSTGSVLELANAETIAGNIIGSGRVVKDGGGVSTLAGTSSYTGGTLIKSGVLVGGIAAGGDLTVNAGGEYHSGGADRSVGILNGDGVVDMQNANLAVNVGVFNGQLNNTKDLVKNSAGDLALGQPTALSGKLDVRDGSLSINAIQDAIKADSADFAAGTALNVAGYSGTGLGDSMTLLATQNGINGDPVISIGGGATASDYLTLGVAKTQDNKSIVADVHLSWVDTAKNPGGDFSQAHGTFTLAGANERFTLDTALADRSAADIAAGFASGWDGKSLVKDGLGTLVLTGNNSYSGGTLLKAGVLEITSDNNLGAVGGALTFAGGTLRAAGDIATSRALVLDADGIIDTGAHRFESLGVISGNGGLTKTGSGILAMGNVNTYSGTTTVREGTLELGNGSAIQGPGAFVLDAGATLSRVGGGAASISGPASIGGHVLVGVNSVMNFAGNVSLLGGSTLELQGSQNAEMGKLIAGGVIDVKGETKVITGGEDYYRGKVAIEAAGGIVGAENLRSDVFRLAHEGNQIVIGGVQRFAQIQNNLFGNNQSVNLMRGADMTDKVMSMGENPELEAALEQYAAGLDNQYLGIDGQYKALRQLYGEYGVYRTVAHRISTDRHWTQIDNHLDQLSFDRLLTTAMNGGVASDRAMASVSQSRPINAPSSRNTPITRYTVSPRYNDYDYSGESFANRIWGGGFGAWADQKSRSGIAGYKYDAGGFILGYDRRVNDCLLFGFAASYTSGRTKIRDLSANHDSDIMTLSVYGSYTHEIGLFARFGASWGYGWSDYNVHLAMGGKKDGKYHTNNFSANAELGYEARLPYNFNLIPSVSVDYGHIHSSGWNETTDGSGVANWFGSGRDNTVDIPLAVRANRVWHFGGGRYIAPELRVAWVPTIGDKRPTIKTGYAGSGVGMVVNGVNPANNRWQVGAGVKARITRNLEARMDYKYEFRSGYKDHNLTASLGLSF